MSDEVESESGQASKKKERAIQPRRNAASIRAYANAKMTQFLASYGKLQRAADLMDGLDPDVVIVPHTTNWDEWMTKIDERADEFLYKAGKAKNNPEAHRLKPGESVTF